MGREIPDIISNVVCWKPGQFSFKHTKTFPKIFISSRHRSFRHQKMEIFRRCLEIEGKARYSLRERKRNVEQT